MGSCHLPNCSLDLTPLDYHIFTKLKEFLGDTAISSNKEMKEAVETCIWEQAKCFQ